MYIPVYRVQLVRDGRVRLDQKLIVKDPAGAADLVRRYLDDVDREVFVALVLDIKNRLIGMYTVSIGSLDATVIHPREVFKAAILLNAASILVAHNHPSGNVEPSPEDKSVTERLVLAGQILGIDVLDHLIVGEGHTSLRERGLMSCTEREEKS